MNSILTIPMEPTALNPNAESVPAAAVSVSAAAHSVDHVAFSILVRQHHRQFLAYARSLMFDDSAARDLTQEALLTAFRSLGNFDTTADFPAWVRGIIRNKWRELARVKTCEPLSDEVLAGLEAQHSLWQHLQTEAQEKNPLFVKLEACLGKLPDPLKAAVESTYFQSRTSEEAAQQLGVNAAALRKRLERARHALRSCLEAPAASHLRLV